MLPTLVPASMLPDGHASNSQDLKDRGLAIAAGLSHVLAACRTAGPSRKRVGVVSRTKGRVHVLAGRSASEAEGPIMVEVKRASRVHCG